MKQVGGYGLHRGYFAKKYPETSFRLKYFVPSLFLLFVALGTLAVILEPKLLFWYIIGWTLYGFAIVKSALDIHQYEKNLSILLNALYYIFFTHLMYGWNFLRGFVWVRRLKSKLR